MDGLEGNFTRPRQVRYQAAYARLLSSVLASLG